MKIQIIDNEGIFNPSLLAEVTAQSVEMVGRAVVGLVGSNATCGRASILKFLFDNERQELTFGDYRIVKVT